MESLESMVNDPQLSCIVEGVPNAMYHAAPGISKSGLDLIARSPAHYAASLALPRKETPAMRIGTALHTAVLEPDRFQSEYGIMPAGNKNSKKWKEEYAEWAKLGLSPLSSDEWDSVLGMAAQIRALPVAKALLVGDQAKMEVSLFHYNHEWDLRVRVRPDCINMEIGAILDLKTTEDARPDPFGRSALNYRYHVQAAFYSDVWFNKTGQRIKAFTFIAIEKKPPYACRAYVLEPEDIELGRSLYLQDLGVYRECKKSGEWPGYTSDVEPLRLPAWKKPK